jgi:hypothetical protein
MSDVQFTITEQAIGFSVQESPVAFTVGTEDVNFSVGGESVSFPTLNEQIQFVVGTEEVKFEVQGIILQGPEGPPGVSEDEAVYAKRVDFITDNLLYRGEAVVGADPADPVWRIRRITIAGDNDVTEEWAGGTALFDKIWDNRASLIYS